jgi:hypothetical protein
LHPKYNADAFLSFLLTPREGEGEGEGQAAAKQSKASSPPPFPLEGAGAGTFFQALVGSSALLCLCAARLHGAGFHRAAAGSSRGTELQQRMPFLMITHTAPSLGPASAHREGGYFIHSTRVSGCQCQQRRRVGKGLRVQSYQNFRLDRYRKPWRRGEEPEPAAMALRLPLLPAIATHSMQLPSRRRRRLVRAWPYPAPPISHPPLTTWLL